MSNIKKDTKLEQDILLLKLMMSFVALCTTITLLFVFYIYLLWK